MEGNTLLILFATLSIIITSTLLLLLLSHRRHPNSSPPLPPSPPSLPIIGHLHILSLPLHHSLLRLSRIYGPVVLLRLGTRRTLVVSSLAAIQECMIKNDLTFSNRPALPSLKDLTHDHTAFGVSPYGPLWQSHRRTAHAVLFSPSIIQSLSAGIIHQEVKVMLRSLLKKEKGRGVCTLRPKLSEVTMNVMMRAVAGKRCFGEDEDDITEIGRRFRWLVEEFFHVVNGVHVGDYFPFLKWVGAGLWERRRRKRVERELDEMAAELLEEVREERNKRKDNKSKMKKSTTAPTTVVETLVEMQEWEGKETYNENYLKGMIQNSLSDLKSTIIADDDIIASMISAADADCNDFVDFDEFERVLDADHDGKTSLSDLKSTIISGDDVIASLISAAVADRNSFVDFNEFERVLGGDRGGMGER